MVASRLRIFNAVFCILSLIYFAGCGKKTPTEDLIRREVHLKQIDKRLERLEGDIDSLRKSIRQLKVTLTELQTKQELAARIEKIADTGSTAVPASLPQDTDSTSYPSERQVTEFSGSYQVHEIPFSSEEVLKQHFRSVKKKRLAR